jgi:hypothetical protein
LDDEQELKGRLLPFGDGAVAAHCLAHPLPAEPGEGQASAAARRLSALLRFGKASVTLSRWKSSAFAGISSIDLRDVCPARPMQVAVSAAAWRDAATFQQ